MSDRERMEEYWVPIKGYPNYAVSNYGNVRNVRTDKDLKVAKTAGGRLQVTIRNYEGPSSHYVHQLVAAAFFQNFKRGQRVSFINGIMHDCSVVNLSLKSKAALRKQLSLRIIPCLATITPHEAHVWEVRNGEPRYRWCEGVK